MKARFFTELPSVIDKTLIHINLLAQAELVKIQLCFFSFDKFLDLWILILYPNVLIHIFILSYVTFKNF